MLSLTNSMASSAFRSNSMPWQCCVCGHELFCTWSSLSYRHQKVGFYQFQRCCSNTLLPKSWASSCHFSARVQPFLKPGISSMSGEHSELPSLWVSNQQQFMMIFWCCDFHYQAVYTRFAPSSRHLQRAVDVSCLYLERFLFFPIIVKVAKLPNLLFEHSPSSHSRYSFDDGGERRSGPEVYRWWCMSCCELCRVILQLNTSRKHPNEAVGKMSFTIDKMATIPLPLPPANEWTIQICVMDCEPFFCLMPVQTASANTVCSTFPHFISRTFSLLIKETKVHISSTQFLSTTSSIRYDRTPNVVV